MQKSSLRTNSKISVFVLLGLWKSLRKDYSMEMQTNPPQGYYKIIEKVDLDGELWNFLLVIELTFV